MSRSEPDDPLLAVTRDLREIESLAESLPDEATHAGIRADIMAMLGHVANLEAWGYIIDARDERELDTSHIDDHDPDWEPPLQTLEFWSEDWRRQHGMELDTQATVASEAGFLCQVLGWAWDNEPRFADFTRDVGMARRRVEDALKAGERAERGVPCMYDQCDGVRLIRKLERVGRKWQHTDWFCPRRPDEHVWDEDAYARMVTAAHEATKRELLAGEMWTTIDVAARAIGRSYRTVQTWINEGKVRKACIIAGRRQPFVAMQDVHDADTRAAHRKRGTAA